MIPELGMETRSLEYSSQNKSAYEHIVKWRKNIFQILKGTVGKPFVDETAHSIDGWCQKTSVREIAFMAITIMPNLLLQKTSNTAKSKDNKDTLKRRLDLWKSGKIDALVREGDAIQRRIPAYTYSDNSIDEKAKRFKNLIISGKINPALRLLKDDLSAGSILPINNESLELLHEKHPKARPLYDELILEGPVNKIERVIFDAITPELIQKIALKSKGAAGPSLLDAEEWKRMIGSKTFGNSGLDLCRSIASFAKILATDVIEDPESLTAFLACRLIPLDKNPGLRPIGIGELLRRITGKAITSVLKNEMMSAAGTLQLCVGIESGVEANVHSMREIFAEDDTEGVIQVDANNAFNTFNRSVLLHNIWILCPEIAT